MIGRYISSRCALLVKRPELPYPDCGQLHRPDLCGVGALTSKYSVHECDRQSLLWCISSLARRAALYAAETRRRGTFAADWRTPRRHRRNQGSPGYLDDLFALQKNP